MEGAPRSNDNKLLHNKDYATLISCEFLFPHRGTGPCFRFFYLESQRCIETTGDTRQQHKKREKSNTTTYCILKVHAARSRRTQAAYHFDSRATTRRT